MDLTMEKLDAIEAPMSDNFWIGFGIGATVILGAGATVAAIVVLT